MDVAFVHSENGVVKSVVGIFRTVGEYVGAYILVKPLVAIRVKDKACVRITHFVYAVYKIVVGIVRRVVKTVDGNPEVSVAVVVLIFHSVGAEHFVVVP